MSEMFQIASFLLDHQEFKVYPFSRLVHIWYSFYDTYPDTYASCGEFSKALGRFQIIFRLLEVNLDTLDTLDGTENDHADKYCDVVITLIDTDKIASILLYLTSEELAKIKKDTEIPSPKHVVVLKDQLNGEELLKSLNEPITSPFQELETIFKAPLTLHILMERKTRMTTQKKPFYTVCQDDLHINLLASMNINNNDRSTTILEKIRSSSPETFRCCQLKIHYIPRVTSFTDQNLGDCSYLDTCHRMKSCRYLHYYTLYPRQQLEEEDIKDKFKQSKQKLLDIRGFEYTLGEDLLEYERPIVPAQWINCDIRDLPFKILGKFAAIISDPSWDIHTTNSSYGISKDEELLSLPINELQDEGIMMLWVTGRSIETGRKALQLWNYEISDELIWVKLNQLRRTIVTGRTGHWLNHSKEHLLVGIKGNPVWLNRKLDSSVIASPTRETLRKPDEIYEIVERIVGKNARKLELFGKEHNIRPGWMTIGNQLPPTSLYEKMIVNDFEKHCQN